MGRGVSIRLRQPRIPLTGLAQISSTRSGSSADPTFEGPSGLAPETRRHNPRRVALNRHCFERREWDSNPRCLATQRFSRPSDSSALASLQLNHRISVTRLASERLQLGSGPGFRRSGNATGTMWAGSKDGAGSTARLRPRAGPGPARRAPAQIPTGGAPCSSGIGRRPTLTGCLARASIAVSPLLFP